MIQTRNDSLLASGRTAWGAIACSLILALTLGGCTDNEVAEAHEATLNATKLDSDPDPRLYWNRLDAADQHPLIQQLLDKAVGSGSGGASLGMTRADAEGAMEHLRQAWETQTGEPAPDEVPVRYTGASWMVVARVDT